MIFPRSEELASCARWAVTGADVIELAAMDDRAWSGLLGAARRERLAGVVSAAAREQRLSLERREQIADLESEWALHTMRAERTMLDVVARLGAAGIEVRVLKGSVFAHGYWPAPELRVFGDADVLVQSADLDRAVALILADGGQRPLPQVRRGFDRRFGKSVTMRNADGLEIDLHRTLVAGPHTFLVPEADLWRPPSHVSIAGQEVPSFGPELQVVHAATHAVASTSPRLASVLDMAFTGLRADLEAASEVAARWKLRSVVQEAGARLEALIGPTGGPVVEWAASLRPTQEEQRLFELFTGQRSFRRSALAAAPYIDRRTDRARFLLSLAFPSRAHRRAR